MDGNFCESVGEDGLISSTGRVLEELLLTRCGFLPFIWLCRLVKGGVGGLFVRAGNAFPSWGLSFGAIGEDRSIEGGSGNGLFPSLAAPVVGLWLRGVATAATGGVSSVLTLVIAAVIAGFVSVSFLPCLVRGTDGLCRACGATGLDSLRLSTLASSQSSSCDVRGVSVEVLVMGSKID
jgi:hypothetical protein